MLNVSGFDDKKILGGVDGAGGKVVDIRVNKIKDFDVLEFYVAVNTALNGDFVSDGFEQIEAAEVKVVMWMPVGTEDSEKIAKKVKGNNSVLSQLSGEFVEGDDAWMGALPGGPLHEAILENSAPYVQVNEYNGKKSWNFCFNANKPPKLTFDEFKAQYAKRKAAEAAANAEVLAAY